MSKKLCAVLLCNFLFYFSGCAPVTSTPQARWKVELTRPNGEVHKTWTVNSRLEPKVDTLWGGQLELYRDSGNGVYETTGLIAPTGWMFDCQKIKSK